MAIRITRAAEQNFTDKAGARLCLRRVEIAGDPEVRFTLHTTSGLYRIGRVVGGQGDDRLPSHTYGASWWFAESADEDLRDGYERLWENGYNGVAAILRRYGLQEAR